MSDSLEELRRKEVELQKKQLFAQRLTAVAAVASAVNTAQTAEAVEKMRREANAAAEATARHQRVLEIQQTEMAVRQEQMAEEQRVTNFRQTVLSTLPLLKEEEKAQYLIEQLLPMVEKRYATEKGDLRFKTIVKIFKFSDFAQNFFATGPEIKEAMREGKAYTTKLFGKVEACGQALHDLEDEQNKKHWSSSWKHALPKVGVLFGILAFILLMLLAAVVPLAPGETLPDVLCWLAVLVSAALAWFILVRIRKQRQNHLDALSSKAAALKAELDSETGSDASKKYFEASKGIKNRLVDSYLASDAGKKFAEFDMFAMLMFLWMECVTTEQAFLPPSARLSEERWNSWLKPKVELEAERAKQRQSKIRDILLSRLAPNYDLGQYELADLEERFVDLNLEREDAMLAQPILPPLIQPTA